MLQVKPPLDFIFLVFLEKDTDLKNDVNEMNTFIGPAWPQEI